RDAAASGSCEIAGLQCGVSLVDDLQLFFGCLVAAMRVGVVQFDQGLISRLEPYQGEGRLDFEHGKSLLARRQSTAHRIPSMVAIAPPALPRPVRVAREDAEMVADSLGISGTVAIAQPPRGALPARVVAGPGLDLGVAHPDIIVPS